MFLVGGAAMALAYNARRATRDVDGVFEPKTAIYSVPSPTYLLALKVAAARVDRDADDITVLTRLGGLTTAAQVLDVTERVMGSRRRPLEPKVQFLVEKTSPAT